MIGTIPILPEGVQATLVLPKYEASSFGPTKNSMPDESSGNKEIYDSDINTYKPVYPVYADFSVTNQPHTAFKP